MRGTFSIFLDILRGLDVYMETQPIVAFLGGAMLIGIAVLMLRIRPQKLKTWFKSLSEGRQMAVGAVGCTVFLLMTMLFAVLYRAGNSLKWQ